MTSYGSSSQYYTSTVNKQVLAVRLLNQGLSDGDIAARLHWSDEEVRQLRRRLRAVERGASPIPTPR